MKLSDVQPVEVQSDSMQVWNCGFFYPFFFSEKENGGIFLGVPC